MITSLANWNTLPQLQTIITKSPSKVHIKGKKIQDGTEYEGYVSEIPYGTTILVKHKNKMYAFSKKTDGTYQVIQ